MSRCLSQTGKCKPLTTTLSPSEFMDLPQDTEVASFRLPIHASGLADLVTLLERIYGRELRMREQPQGWMQISTPAKKEAGQ
jgi:hypothetical protein